MLAVVGLMKDASNPKETKKVMTGKMMNGMVNLLVNQLKQKKNV